MNWSDIITSLILILISIILFVLLQPGSIITIPGNSQLINFGPGETNFKAVILHTIIFGIALSAMVIFYTIIIKPIF
jgi:hypothetical protein